jgi:hypothetical protein
VVSNETKNSVAEINERMCEIQCSTIEKLEIGAELRVAANQTEHGAFEINERC